MLFGSGRLQPYNEVEVEEPPEPAVGVDNPAFEKGGNEEKRDGV